MRRRRLFIATPAYLLRMAGDFLGCRNMTLILKPMQRVHRDWHGVDDYAVFSGNLQMGRIYQDVTNNNADVRWFWSITGAFISPAVGAAISGRAESRQAAQAELAANWRKWLAWAGLQESAQPTATDRLAKLLSSDDPANQLPL